MSAAQATHGVGLGDFTGPPFVRFERKAEDLFAVWIATPADADVDAVNETINRPESYSEPLAQLLLRTFGYQLSPDEAALVDRYIAHDTGDDFWVAADAAGLAYIHSVTRQLAKMPPGVVAMETNLARSPVFVTAAARSRHLQLSLLPEGTVYGKPFRVLDANGLLTPRDALGLTHVFRSYANDPSNRRISVTLNEAAAWAGYSGKGGKTRQLVRQMFMRWRAATQQGERRFPDGTAVWGTWGLVDATYTRETQTGEGMAWVRISEEAAALIRAGSLTYLDADVLARLVNADELAAQLWLFLEAESLPWKYQLFNAPEGQPPRQTSSTIITELLRLEWGGRRMDVVRRLRRACTTIGEVDARYHLRIVASRSERSMWVLEAGRRQQLPRRRQPQIADTDTPGKPHDDGMTCGVCGQQLTPDEHVNDELSTYIDGQGWCHTSCLRKPRASTT